MTTIAYHHDSGEIAVDGRTTAGGIIVTDKSNKIIRRQDGALFFMTGATSDFADYCNEFSNGKKPSRAFDCGAMAVFDGVVHLTGVDGDSGFFASPRGENCAIGSGSHFATAAMDFGKSAKQAVKYAATRDSSTGGKITVVKVK